MNVRALLSSGQTYPARHRHSTGSCFSGVRRLDAALPLLLTIPSRHLALQSYRNDPRLLAACRKTRLRHFEEPTATRNHLFCWDYNKSSFFACLPPFLRQDKQAGFAQNDFRRGFFNKLLVRVEVADVRARY